MLLSVALNAPLPRTSDVSLQFGGGNCGSRWFSQPHIDQSIQTQLPSDPTFRMQTICGNSSRLLPQFPGSNSKREPQSSRVCYGLLRQHRFSYDRSAADWFVLSSDSTFDNNSKAAAQPDITDCIEANIIEGNIQCTRVCTLVIYVTDRRVMWTGRIPVVFVLQTIYTASDKQ